MGGNAHDAVAETDAATTMERLVQRDRAVVLFGIALIAATAWAYTIHLASTRSDFAMPMVQPWGAIELTTMFVMWAVMMVAMMLPSAAPMIVLFAGIQRRRRETGRPWIPVAWFAAAYLALWTGFSLLATITNWALHQGGALTSMMGRIETVDAAGLLVLAGLYQWTPLKTACLRRCRSPLSFLLTEWREGSKGAVVMGVRHGVYCLLCCWALMSLLFVLGVMNLVWIAALTGVTIAEKILPGGARLSRVLGLGLIAWGAWTMAMEFALPIRLTG